MVVVVVVVGVVVVTVVLVVDVIPAVKHSCAVVKFEQNPPKLPIRAFVDFDTVKLQRYVSHVQLCMSDVSSTMSVRRRGDRPALPSVDQRSVLTG